MLGSSSDGSGGPLTWQQWTDVFREADECEDAMLQLQEAMLVRPYTRVLVYVLV